MSLLKVRSIGRAIKSSGRVNLGGPPMRNGTAGAATRSATRFAVVMLGLVMCYEPELQAGQVIGYLSVPASGTANLPGDYYLPGYNGSVNVSVTGVPGSQLTYFDQTGAQNQSAGPFSWGTDTTRFNIFNNTSSNENYTFTFDFLNGPPAKSDLLLVVAGLARGTTAKVSEPGSLVGEYNFGGLTSKTVFDSNTLTFSSDGSGDPRNTGWALYQPSGQDTTLSLDVQQVPADGIGFTVAYAVPEPATLTLFLTGLIVVAGAVAFERRRCSRPGVAPAS